MSHLFSPAAHVKSLTEVLEFIARHLNLRLSVRLWNGDEIPLGREVHANLFISLSGPGVVGTLLRRPTLETVTRLYAQGHIDIHGGNLLDIHAALQTNGSSRAAIRQISKLFLAKKALPFLFTKTSDADLEHGYTDDMVGRRESRRVNMQYIQFHYDAGNDFYQLFLDAEMQYTCGYYKDWNNSLEQSQLDKMEMICRKLRLEPGESMLDMGCGWGGLICYAASNHGVKAHGVTLSKQQYDFAQAKIRSQGLEDLVTVEHGDYRDVEGRYDKISSIGLMEHVGVANHPSYFGQIRSMLRDGGILLNHALARSSKKSKRRARKIRPERKLLLKYIFPGSELTSVGFTQNAMEHHGFEVHDVEALREHYALTCRAWCQRLSANEEKAIKLVGYEKYRMWVAYLAGASVGLQAGSIKIYQIVATKKAGKGRSGLPPTRSDLYRSQRDPNQMTGENVIKFSRTG